MNNFDTGDKIKLIKPYLGFQSESGIIIERGKEFIYFKLKFKNGKQITAKATPMNMNQYFITDNSLDSISNYLNNAQNPQLLHGMPLREFSSGYIGAKEFPKDFTKII